MSASFSLIHLNPYTMADNPEAQAELTVKEGPLNLCRTLRVAAGMLVSTCSMDSLFTVLNPSFCDYSM